MSSDYAPRRLRLAGVAAALTIVVAVIHLQDQNWLKFEKDPSYVQIGYITLELACLLAAVLLLTRDTTIAWLLAAGCAVGPIVGFVLSRGPGLPNYTDDRGNWGEPLGIVSLVVEGLLLLVAVTGASHLTSTMSTDRHSTATRIPASADA